MDLENQIKGLSVEPNLAMKYYKKGIEEERNNRYPEAIANYRKALRLDPDIEKKFGLGLKLKSSRATSKSTLREVVEKPSRASEELAPHTPVINNTGANVLEKRINLLKLPIGILIEIIIALCKISRHSIFNISQTCKFLNHLIYHESIWQEMSLWMVKTKCAASFTITKKMKWLNAWMNNPHLRRDGIYISTTTYQREGIPSPELRKAHLRHFQTVVYYRVLSVCTNGLGNIMCTPKSVENVKLGSKQRMEGENAVEIIFHEPNLVAIVWAGAGKEKETVTALLRISDTRKGMHDLLEWDRFYSTSSDGSVLNFSIENLGPFQFKRE